MIASEIVERRERPDVDRHPPPAAIVSTPRPVGTTVRVESGRLTAFARRVGTFSGVGDFEAVVPVSGGRIRLGLPANGILVLHRV
jgi:hypothetical protein